MKIMHVNLTRVVTCWLAAGLLGGSSLLLAQNAPNSNNGGWQRFGGNSPSAQPAPEPPDPNQAAPAPYPNDAPSPAAPQSNFSVPPQLTLKPGTFLTVRVDQYLSSDKNQMGDAFSATLMQPVIVDGIIVAQRGQTIGGRVVEAQKAPHGGGNSKLGIQLTDLTLVDGQVLPIQTQLNTRTGPSSTGRDAAAIGTTTGVGAAVGAVAAGGIGAAVGAGAGAVAGAVGVMLTRGHPTIVGPESVLTFRVEQPVTISTERAPQAFRPVEPPDYNRQPGLQSRPGYAPPPPPYYSSYYPYGYPYYPYYWGPGLGFYYGGFYGPRVFIGGRFGGFRR